MEKRRVVITGLGTVNPLGNTVAESWAAAKAGKCGIAPITQFDTTDFKCKLAGEVKDFDPETVVDKKEVRKMARFTLLALGAAAEAIAAATIIEKTVDEEVTVMFEYPFMNDMMRIVKEEEPEILNQSYDMDCSMTLRIRRSMMAKLRARLEKVETARILDEKENH